MQQTGLHNSVLMKNQEMSFGLNLHLYYLQMQCNLYQYLHAFGFCAVGHLCFAGHCDISCSAALYIEGFVCNMEKA